MTLLCDKVTRLGLEDHGVQNGKDRFLDMQGYDQSKKYFKQSNISLTRFCEKWTRFIDRMLLIAHGHGNLSKWDVYAKKFTISTDREDNRSAPNIKLALTTKQPIFTSGETILNDLAYVMQMKSSIRIIYNPLESKTVCSTLQFENLLGKIKLSNYTPRVYDGLKKLFAVKSSYEAQLEYDDQNMANATNIWKDIWANPEKAAEHYKYNRIGNTNLSEELKMEKYNIQDDLLFDTLMTKITATRFLCPYYEM